MNVQQLRYVRETIRQGLNLTAAARRSAHIAAGNLPPNPGARAASSAVEFFVRRGKRVIDLTESGRALAPIVDRVLQEIDNLRSAAADFNNQDSGALTVATTHTQARYALPAVVAAFKKGFSARPLEPASRQSAADRRDGLARRRRYRYRHRGARTITRRFSRFQGTPGSTVWSSPADHPLLAEPRLSLDALARYPLITYDPAFAGRSHIDEAFAARDLHPDVVLAAIDSDVIKTYVELGLGVGIMAAMAFDATRDRQLRMLDASKLSAPIPRVSHCCEGGACAALRLRSSRNSRRTCRAKSSKRRSPARRRATSSEVKAGMSYSALPAALLRRPSGAPDRPARHR